MSSARAVEGLDEVEDGHPGLDAGASAGAGDQLALEGGDEALGQGIVIAVADHRSAWDAGASTILTSVLTTARTCDDNLGDALRTVVGPSPLQTPGLAT